MNDQQSQGGNEDVKTEKLYSEKQRSPKGETHQDVRVDRKAIKQTIKCKGET